jgi:biopolymer transport protein ExbB/TolQ
MFEPLALIQMWKTAWPVISLLLGCSVLSGAIILERWTNLTRASFDREALMAELRKLLLENRREQARARCENLRKPVGRVLCVVLESRARGRANDKEDLERAAGRAIRHEVSLLSRYLTGLGTIGSVAPFIGLFGTVLGIIHAFRAISENAGGGPGVVANGIAEALITTALGLFVAIPAVVVYNLCIRKVERITEDMELCSEEVIDLLNSH